MNQDMAAYFDRLAPEWDNAPSEFDTREKLISLMELQPNSVIADIGCGKGVMFQHLLKTGPAKLLAVDISGEMLRSAQRLCGDGRVEYINDDFLDASLPLLDAAVIFNAYPHFLDKEALQEKLAQVLRKDDVLIIAHSVGKAEINGTHRGGSASNLSVPLEDAESEAGKFQQFFSPEILIDSDEMYFIKMIRR